MVEYKNSFGQLHRDGGLPAIECLDGYKVWYFNGQVHREDGPAVEYADGTKVWFKNGQLHRDGGLPAVERTNGTKKWYVSGREHRGDGFPAVECANGCKEWYISGNLHRDNNLPAVEYANNYGYEWWVNGKRKRHGDLPTCEFTTRHNEWHDENGKIYRIEGISGESNFWYTTEINKQGKSYRKTWWDTKNRIDNVIGWIDRPRINMIADQICIITLIEVDDKSTICECIGCHKVYLFEAMLEWLNITKICPHCRRPWTHYIRYIPKNIYFLP